MKPNNLSGIIAGIAMFMLVILLFMGNTPESQYEKNAENPSIHLPVPSPMIGEIRMFGGNFAPRGWAFCEGQLIKVTDNPALFSVLGTMYGGDGRTTFALPDFRGRVPVGPNNTSIKQGIKFGNEFIPLSTQKQETRPQTSGTEFYINQGKIQSYQPGLGIQFIIAVAGDFPQRN